MTKNNYQPLGEEWMKEVSNLTKNNIIDMLAEALTYKTLIPNESTEDCKFSVEGVLKELKDGIITLEKASIHMANYTFRLHDLYVKKLEELIITNIECLRKKGVLTSMCAYALQEEGIEDLWDLKSKTRQEIGRIKNIGKKALAELDEQLKMRNWNYSTEK